MNIWDHAKMVCLYVDKRKNSSCCRAKEDESAHFSLYMLAECTWSTLLPDHKTSTWFHACSLLLFANLLEERLDSSLLGIKDHYYSTWHKKGNDSIHAEMTNSPFERIRFVLVWYHDSAIDVLLSCVGSFFRYFQDGWGSRMLLAKSSFGSSFCLVDGQYRRLLRDILCL